MLYFYFDESYNFQPNAKKQFLLIGGFATHNPALLTKEFQRVKRFSLPKRWKSREIKSTDSLFDKKLKEKILKIFQTFCDPLYIILQNKTRLSYKYFSNNKFNYDKLYLDLLEQLLIHEVKIRDETKLIITLDDFSPSVLSKKQIINKLKSNFKEMHSDISIEVNFAQSKLVPLLQIADMISGLFYKLAVGKDIEIDLYTSNIKIVSNPLA